MSNSEVIAEQIRSELLQAQEHLRQARRILDANQLSGFKIHLGSPLAVIDNWLRPDGFLTHLAKPSIEKDEQ